MNELCLKHHIEKVEELYEDGNSMSSNWICSLCQLVSEPNLFNEKLGKLNEPTKDLIRHLLNAPITSTSDIAEIVEYVERIAKYSAVSMKNQIINQIERN